MKVCSMLEGVVVGMIIFFGLIILIPRKYFNQLRKIRRKANKSMGSINSMIGEM